MVPTRDFNQPDIRSIGSIIKNYIQNEKALVNQLHFKANQGSTIGGFREDIWRGMFEQIVPRKFVIEQSVFIIDSQGRVSNEVDLAIFDETYTPYIFRYGRLKFLPIEAVAVVVECKSTSLDQNILSNWAQSVAALKTSSKSYIRTITEIIVGEEKPSPTQTQTRPLRILCCLGETIVNRLLGQDSLFDIIIRAPSPDGELHIVIDTGKETLKDWYLALNHASPTQRENIKDGANIGTIKLDDYRVNCGNIPVSLLSLNLQLNQLLMLINNPILFPHKAYTEMFNTYAAGINQLASPQVEI